VPLRADPHLAPAILAQLADAGVGFDIALMGGLGLVSLHAHDIGRGKACLDIAMPELDVTRHVRMHPCRHGIVGNAFADDGRPRCHCRIDIGHMRENFVFHFDQPGGILRQQGRCRRHRRHRVTIIKRLLAGQRVFLQIKIFARQAFRKVSPRHHGLHPLERKRP